MYQANGWIACRYTEAYEREWRQKEKAARERVAATNRDLAQARAAQQAARVAAQADMARLEAQEFYRIVEENRHSEQQQLEKVCTCAPEYIIYTHTYVSGIICTYTRVYSIIITMYAGSMCQLCVACWVCHMWGPESCWECMLVMGVLWFLTQATSVHVADMWRKHRTSINISTC